MIIDAHVHLPVVKSGSGFDFEVAKKKLLSDMKDGGIDAAVMIPDNIRGSGIGDLDICLRLTESEKNIFLLGTIDVRSDGKEWMGKLDRLFREDKIRGIKIFPGHDPIYPTDERLMPVYKLCVKYGRPIVIHTGSNPNHPEAAEYNDPKHIVEVAKQFPDLKIVIAHYFYPEVDYCYDMTRGFRNIHFDTSGLADEEVVRRIGLNKIRDVLERTVRDNPESVLFGTDYAICGFQEHIDLINSLKIPGRDKERIFWKNAKKLFKL